MKVTKENFKPVGHVVFIKPLGQKYKTVIQKQPVDNTDIDKITEVEDVKTKVYYNQQLAEVIEVGTGLPNAPYKKGDTVVYDKGQLREFDLIKGTAMITDFAIVGIVE